MNTAAGDLAQIVGAATRPAESASGRLTKTIRLYADGPGLLDWFDDYAADHGMTANAALVLALRTFARTGAAS
jgi:hypothetical protein